MPSDRVLVVEDDKHITKLVTYNLEKAGCICLTAGSGEDALEILSRESVKLIILDVMLPQMDGFEVCRTVKQNEKSASIPIIMLTAKGEEVDRIVGFELGADDYVVKPFSPRELVLRVKAILKRGTADSMKQEIISTGSLVIDIAKHKVLLGKKEVILTAMEFNLLVTLLQRQGRVQSRDRLLDDVWDLGSDVTTRTVDTHIKRLRQKLGKIGKNIETIRGVGYRFREEE